jgi:peptidoglycan/LPS O-acetylase OafA/YrhL
MACTIELVVYRRDIDGMRALAVAVVVAFHGFPAALPGGFVGVDIFFVISGYLITGIVKRALETGTFSFRSFYARRIRRIFPALAVVLILSLAAGWFLLLPLRYASLGVHVTAAAGFVSNFLVWTEAGYFAAQSVEKPLLHLWSLGIEEQFYLLWPLALWLASRVRVPIVRPVAIVAVVSFAVGLAVTWLSPDAAFYLPASRIWELALGGVLVSTKRGLPAWIPRIVASGAGLAAIAFAVVAFDSTSPYPGWRALFPSLGACLVIAAGEQTAINRVLLGNPVVVAIGRISYPLYLWHWVLLSFGFLVANAEPSIAVRLALIGGSLALAALTYLLVERPLRSREATGVQALALSLVLVAAAAGGRGVAAMDGFPGRFPVVVQTLLDYHYDFLTDAHAGECWIAAPEPATAFRASCFPSATEGHPVLFLWGDSHAARLRPGVEAVYGQSYRIGSATRDSCPPALDAPGPCGEGNRFILAELVRTRPAIVVLFANWSGGTEAIASVVRTSEELVGAGIPRVVIVGPAPHWTTNLPTAIYEAWRHGSVAQPLPQRLRSGRSMVPYDVERAMKGSTWPRSVEYHSALDLVCDGDGCLTFVPGSSTELMTYDYGHLTTAGAAVVARGLHLDALAPR